MFPDQYNAADNVARLFSPVHAPIDTQRAIGFNHSYLQQQAICERVFWTEDKALLIIAGCATTAQSWCECTKLLGLKNLVFQSCEAWLQTSMKSGAAHPMCLLIDDSAYLDVPAQQYVNRMNEDIRALVAQHSNCPLVIAANMPRWSDWCLWSKSGACEIIAKPANGVPFCRFLKSSCGSRSDYQS